MNWNFTQHSCVAEILMLINYTAHTHTHLYVYLEPVTVFYKVDVVGNKLILIG